MRLRNGQPPLHLDYGPPKARVADYMGNESRFRMIERADPERYKKFVESSTEAARRRYVVYQQLAGISVPPVDAPGAEAPTPAPAGEPAPPAKEGA
jgi:pyruvate-ferredoxin/flavodoxin oxidoreductase